MRIWLACFVLFLTQCTHLLEKHSCPQKSVTTYYKPNTHTHTQPFCFSHEDILASQRNLHFHSLTFKDNLCLKCEDKLFSGIFLFSCWLYYSLTILQALAHRGIHCMHTHFKHFSYNYKMLVLQSIFLFIVHFQSIKNSVWASVPCQNAVGILFVKCEKKNYDYSILEHFKPDIVCLLLKREWSVTL